MIDEDLDIVCRPVAGENEKLFGDSLAEYELPNFDLFTYQRQHKKGGGILIYVKNILRAHRTDEFKTSEEVESIWLDVILGVNVNNRLRIGAFYRPPGQTPSLDQALSDEIEAGISNRSILMGDFNLPKLLADPTLSVDRSTLLFRDTFEENFLVQLIREPTRKEEILDLLLVNEDNLITNVAVGESLGNSDHNIILFQYWWNLRANMTIEHLSPIFVKQILMALDRI